VDYLAVRNAEKMSKEYFNGRNYGRNGGPDSGRWIAAVPVIVALALLLALHCTGGASGDSNTGSGGQAHVGH
jgi:hypothetical protein